MAPRQASQLPNWLNDGGSYECLGDTMCSGTRFISTYVPHYRLSCDWILVLFLGFIAQDG